MTIFLMIDNYDSFVYNLVRYFNELEQEIVVRRNDEISIEEIEIMKPKGIILSPGPKSPAYTGISTEIVRVFGDKIPILGICLGHQTIGYVHGANIIESPIPAHGKVTSIRHDGKGLFQGLSNPMNVTRYHSLIIERESLSNDFEITCQTHGGIIMGIRHTTLLLEGVQFHPEAELTDFGHELLQNFINWCNVL